MLSATTQWALVAGNILVLLGFGISVVRWLRNWLMKQVAQPVENLQTIVQEQGKKIEDVDTRAREAHVRLDTFILEIGRQHHA